MTLDSQCDWQTIFRAKIKDRCSALSRIHKGKRIFVGSACGEPQYLVEGLADQTSNVVDAEVLHLLTIGAAPFANRNFKHKFRHNSFFVGDNTRQAVADGIADYTPVYLSEVPELFESGQISLDAALIQVSPPDEKGYVSFGVSVDVTKTAALNARVVIAQVNPQMPRTLGDSFIHLDDIDALVYKDEPLLEYVSPEPDDVISGIAKNVAKLITDGATLQIGIGMIPKAVAPALKNKKDLGIHTEMFSDWLIDLIEEGIVTNSKKNLHSGKIIASFCMGTRRLYDFIDNNKLIEFHPSDYTNNPIVIAQNDNMVAINGALQIDLTGQVCSDSIGHHFYSGIGGQVDFIRGAAMSKNGKAIIAITSTVKEGKVSTIVPVLSPGAGVVTTRGSVRYIVTEWGWADLHGKSIRERALALISLAHPKFRGDLLEEAKKLRYVTQDQIISTGGYYPDEYELSTTLSGKSVLFRPIKATDEGGLKEFFYSLSDETIYRRYFSMISVMPHERLQLETNIDYETDLTIAVLTVIGRAWKIIGLGKYSLDLKSDEAEISFVVRDDWQKMGIGGRLVECIVKIARERGVRKLFAVVLPKNHTMLKIFKSRGFAIKTNQSEGYCEAELNLAK